MTRFARAKGSKASNEKLPERATSWSEMKQELLVKNKELAEKQNRESAVKQRQENYQAFLREKEEEQEKKVAWADFPKAHNEGKSEDHPQKRKASLGNTNGFKKAKVDDKKVDLIELNGNDESEDSDGQFSALKSQIDKVLANHNTSLSESDDEPPEEVGNKQKPQDIIIKKAKKIKKKLKIVVDKEEQMSKASEASPHTSPKKKLPQNLPEPVEKNHKSESELLSEKDKRRIEKKQKKKLKQIEKKKLKKQTKGDLKQLENTQGVEVGDKQEMDAKEKAKLEKKLERRKRQKEKLKLRRSLAKNINTESEGCLATAPENSGEQNGLTKVEKVAPPISKTHNNNNKFNEQNQNDQKQKKAEVRDNKEHQLGDVKNLENTQGDEVGEKQELDAKQKAQLEKKLERRKRQKEKLKLHRNLAKNNKTESEGSLAEAPENSKEQNGIIKYDEVEKATPAISKTHNKFNEQNQNNQKQKKAKVRDTKEHQSRKPRAEKMFINGRTVEIDYIDGFPVKKEDADRLKRLRKEMISKGLPRSEINAALKLERRRAEKAFAREKKNVCFNCRKSGHNLSECPDLNKDQVAQSAGTGICFKCGSTEHTHFECKVVRGLDYKFATCFICKEQGHIAKQCPDNQRGLYPKGGSCKVCGDVTHLKKDCPKYQAQQAQLQNTLSIGTLDSGNPDDLDAKASGSSVSGTAKRLNKVIKF